MTTGATALQIALDEILEGDWRDARQVVIKHLNAVGGMTPVVCVRCAPDRPMRFVRVFTHLREVESRRAAANPDLQFSQLHKPGDFRAGGQGEIPSEPWSWTQCRRCNADIIWARTTGKHVSVDRATNPDGTVLLVAMDSSGLGDPYARFLHTESERAGVNRNYLHTLHLTTCTNPKPPRSTT